MAEITKITVSYERTFQIKQYEPAKFAISIEAERSDEVSFDVELESVWLIARQSVREQAVKVYAERDARIAGMTDEDDDPDPLFVICDETCDPEFLAMFLNQVRNWAGKDSIKYDDALDVVAYCDDEALMEELHLGAPAVDLWQRMTQQQTPPPPRRSRYCPQ